MMKLLTRLQAFFSPRSNWTSPVVKNTVEGIELAVRQLQPEAKAPSIGVKPRH